MLGCTMTTRNAFIKGNTCEIKVGRGLGEPLDSDKDLTPREEQKKAKVGGRI